MFVPGAGAIVKGPDDPVGTLAEMGAEYFPVVIGGQ
jgi:hypothetical protein